MKFWAIRSRRLHILKLRCVYITNKFHDFIIQLSFTSDMFITNGKNSLAIKIMPETMSKVSNNSVLKA